jgi:hypothetical protein
MSNNKINVYLQLLTSNYSVPLHSHSHTSRWLDVGSNASRTVRKIETCSKTFHHCAALCAFKTIHMVFLVVHIFWLNERVKYGEFFVTSSTIFPCSLNITLPRAIWHFTYLSGYNLSCGINSRIFKLFLTLVALKAVFVESAVVEHDNIISILESSSASSAWKCSCCVV